MSDPSTLSAFSITVADDGDVAAAIEAGLMESLRENQPPSDYLPFMIAARDRDRALVGGVTGGSAYGWLLIKALWVAKSRRGAGLGARLIEKAAELARSRGCHGVWLDTSSARAARFYARLGFTEFGKLENRPGESPQGHRRIFMCKRFNSGGGA